jgi:hypothetical protein
LSWRVVDFTTLKIPDNTFVSPEKRYCGRRAFTMLVADASARLVASCRLFAAVHSSSETIRNSGTSLVIHSDRGFSLDTRRPVSGFLM